jgi:endonuclease I
MSKTYKIKLTAAQRKLIREWFAVDPVDAFRRLRDRRI